jgi:flagellar basal body-associated protein FliL
MAEEKKENQPEQPQKKMPIKAMLILLAVLLIEGLAITAVFTFAGGPAKVQADPAAVDLAAEAKKPVELLVVSDKFANNRVGRTYLYDSEIYVVLRKKDEEATKAKIETMQAQISTDIAMIIRRAEPAHLNEPTLATLTRQIKASLDERLGKDEETGEPTVEQVLIKKWVPFRADL